MTGVLDADQGARFHKDGCTQIIEASYKCGRLDHGKRSGRYSADLEKVNALLDFLRLEVGHRQWAAMQARVGA